MMHEDDDDIVRATTTTNQIGAGKRYSIGIEGSHGSFIALLFASIWFGVMLLYMSNK
jgi:hypothetical protein